VTTKEPIERLDELWDIPEDTGNEAGLDFPEFDVDDTEGYEPEAYAFGPYQAPPKAWHRNRQVMLAGWAIGLAVVAILVSTVLLVVSPPRESQTVKPSTPATATPTQAPTTMANAPAPAPAGPPAPGAPPPPAGQVVASTVPVAAPPRAEPPGKAPPEINVTRAPIMSVRPTAPAPRFGGIGAG
jgi:hypothetical protein